MSTIKLRQQFLDFFRKNDHRYMPPSKVYNDDPTLLFVNAGMNQLKDVFLGKKEVANTKLMNSQICIRAGGKHNDFDDVGKDSYHLTGFEMLGNWSIGAYDKETAIDLALKFIVEECKLNKDQIYVTYFEGDDNINADDESKKIWLKYIPENRIVKGSTKDNFWSAGNFGPCGPCTEIHYDLVGNRDASNLVNKDDPLVIEIWNIVFMQYNKTETGYDVLNKMYVDTGIGLERLSMILQNKTSLYETDAFRYIIGCAQMLSNSSFYTNSFTNDNDMAYRIFADHFRTTTVALFQGVVFEPYGKGYVMRKIFRRLLCYYYIFLADGLIKPVMHNAEIKSLITRVLDYFLFFTHDADSIQKQMIEEEKLAINKWKNIKVKYNKYNKQYKGNVEKVIEKLKTVDGIDSELVDNIDKLKN